jgi:Helicase conserved C-terminal domain
VTLQAARPTPGQLRDELERLVLADLLGPAGGEEEEVDEDRVRERYLVGMLAPLGVTLQADEQDELATAQEGELEEGRAEPIAPGTASPVPASCGLTCCVDGAVTELRVEAHWGRYRRLPPEHRTPDGPSLVWKRSAMGGAETVRLREGRLHTFEPDPEQPGVVVRGRARRVDGDWLVTLFLVNGQPDPPQLRDHAWLFQVELVVSGVDGGSPFLRRPQAIIEDDPEARRLALAYRDQVEFAAGHGIATHVEVDPRDPRRAMRVRTAAAPQYEVARTDPPTVDEEPALAAADLDMRSLATAPQSELPARLRSLVDAYDGWIERQAARVGDPAARLEGHEAAAADALALCRRAVGRMRAGVELLATDGRSGDAFRFANEAMWRQRVRSRVAERRRKGDQGLPEALEAEEDRPENRTWRPFQLAFVLLCLPGVSDPTHPERSEESGLADLLWFPTGGGKTEAYLLLTAYVLALRRLQSAPHGLEAGDGVAVVMRYTLRLLTVQQFQRAAALLCACETIRAAALARGDRRWGELPFRIGLWVGRRTTPNWTEEAARWVAQQRGAAGWRGGGIGSPAQLTFCPWCGSAMQPGQHVRVDPDRGRTLLFCGDALGRCPFTERQRPGEGLPVVVVDEEVYRLLPGLLIGTVDKFAQMPWVGQSSALFGRVSRRCERHGYVWPDDEHTGFHPRRGSLPPAQVIEVAPLRPPDLIIQDELHLITGPLGSLVGLYETAVERLCELEVGGRRYRPKVIASTATIRRSAQQTHALFLRGVDVFPPQGLDVEDSFFARQRRVTDESFGRRYVGVCAHGRRFKSVLIRVYVALLGASQRLYDLHGRDADHWMTLVGYFNSVRELAGMRRLVEDDIRTRLGRVESRGLGRRRGLSIEELTSRRSSDDIPQVLERLATPFDAERRPPDVVVATNMISVGVDVPRLGAMAVAGQPKSTSEYIQATSRVGRASPGLVVTVYNWAKARDLSHYETFEHYHATFYRQVEAASVTPFAHRALDRGLTGVMASLLRHDRRAWNANTGARAVDTHDPAAAAAVRALARHAALVASDAGLGGQVQAMAQQRLDLWQQEEATKPQLAYRRRGPDTVPLLQEPGVGRWNHWTCPTSLRDVEPEINLQLLRGGDLGEASAPPFDFTRPSDDGADDA